METVDCAAPGFHLLNDGHVMIDTYGWYIFLEMIAIDFLLIDALLSTAQLQDRFL